MPAGFLQELVGATGSCPLVAIDSLVARLDSMIGMFQELNALKVLAVFLGSSIFPFFYFESLFSQDPTDPKNHRAIYAIPCSCRRHYIGETGRSDQLRLREHCANVRHNRIKKSALAGHFEKTGHQIS